MSGFCGIPPALVQRYAEEVNEDVYDVADAIDHLRLRSLVVRGRIGIPNDFLADSCTGIIIEQANCESLHSWLVSIGLPMCEKLFNEHGYTDLKQIATLKESDLITCGISKPTHRRLLITALCALAVNLDKV
ncbi:SAM and SH3 domain-containing protein 1-like protein [Leptotrombidium deliense]|uniref:SAM and SH3 domain-containing protein 1-like protein n=1 Tax=Leptotrombidium deliense TaxID=299467 RepID=A0A443S2U7_9ACAR|nr:SAM and SH3 domain-containing protein 1-like protein [Leptotrombidium deliense]